MTPSETGSAHRAIPARYTAHGTHRLAGETHRIADRTHYVEGETHPRQGPHDAIDEEGEERLCVFAEVDGPRGKIPMFCAHLSWAADHSAIRQAQAAAICQFVKDNWSWAF